jgi:hypothetical protein
VQIGFIEVHQADIEIRTVTRRGDKIHLTCDFITGIEDQNPPAEFNPGKITDRPIEHRRAVPSWNDKREELQRAHSAAA